MNRREKFRQLVNSFDRPKPAAILPETMWIALDPGGQPIPATLGWTRDAAKVFVMAMLERT